MQSIFNAITEWLKALLVEGIMENLGGLFTGVNEQVGEIAAQAGMTPAAWNAGVFSMIRQLSETVILPIAGLVLLDVMDENEIEEFLKNIKHKKEIRKGRKPSIGEIDYWGYLEHIYSRIQKGSLQLSHDGKTYLCLCFLWAMPQKNLSESSTTIESVLGGLASEIENDKLVATLYTEWGIWLAGEKNDSSAEEKFLAVIKYNPDQLPARTELGRLLSRQKGREGEAEKYLQEAIRIDPKNLHSRTVLAKLYESMDRLPEARQLYQELCIIDPGNRFGRDGLSRLK